jgi:hypothetical protein
MEQRWLWKTVENFCEPGKQDTETLQGKAVFEEFGAMSAQTMRACSACAGDYEDPDRTATEDDEAAEEAVDDASIGEDRGESGELREQETEPLAGAETQEDEFPGRLDGATE